MLFTLKERDEYISKITTYAKTHEYIEGFILVGSLSKDNPDRWADIDCAIVIDPSEKTLHTQQQFNSFALKTFDLFHLSETEFAKNSYLTLIFLTNYLEIDIGFISLDKLVAKKKNWKILFEKTDKVSNKMNESWKNRQVNIASETAIEKKSTALYNIRNLCVAINRNKPFRAIDESDDFRTLCINLWGTHENLTTKHYRDVDIFNEEIKTLLKKTYPKDISIVSITYSLHKLLELYFYILKSIGVDKKEIYALKKHIESMLSAHDIEPN